MDEKNKGGRPKFELDVKEFKKLLQIHCTIHEVAGFYDVCLDTIEAACQRQFGFGFSECFKRYSANGKISLRRSQYLLATDKLNPSMLIWLGKQYLDQKDHVEHTGNEKAPIQLAYAPPETEAKRKQLLKKVEEKVTQVIASERKDAGEEADET